LHHVIDPTTGLPAQSEIVLATAIAAECWQAEVLAKAAFFGGLAVLDAVGASGFVVTAAGDRTESGSLRTFARA
jgi:thiamine biosynthesis lipoprotein ApbE